MRMLWAVAWRNLWRNKGRSFFTASAIAVAIALWWATIAVNDGMYASIFEMAVEQQLGHVQVHHPAYPADGVMYDTLTGREALLDEIDAIRGTVAASPRLEGFGLIAGDELSAGLQLIGVPPVRDRQVTGLERRVFEGVYLSDQPANEILVGHKLAEEIEVGVGDEVVLLTQSADGSMGNDVFTVVGLVRSGDVAQDAGAAWLHIADAERLLALPDQAHGISVVCDDVDEIDAYAKRLDAAVGGETVEVQPWWEAAPPLADLMNMRDVARNNLLFVIFLVAAFGVINTMLMAVFERTHELGVLRALGLRPRTLVALVVWEAVFLGLVASAVGLAVGGALVWYLAVHGIDLSASMPEGVSYMGVQLDPVMRADVAIGPVMQVTVAVFLVSVLAALWPAWRAARLNPVAAMREE